MALRLVCQTDLFAAIAPVVAWMVIDGQRALVLLSTPTVLGTFTIAQKVPEALGALGTAALMPVLPLLRSAEVGARWRSALARAGIVLNDKTTGIALQLDDWILRAKARNADQEEAEEEVEINYSGGAMEIGFNVTYLLDALGALNGELAKLSFSDAASSCLLEEAEGSGGKHVIMPMRL